MSIRPQPPLRLGGHDRQPSLYTILYGLWHQTNAHSKIPMPLPSPFPSHPLFASIRFSLASIHPRPAPSSNSITQNSSLPACCRSQLVYPHIFCLQSLKTTTLVPAIMCFLNICPIFVANCVLAGNLCQIGNLCLFMLNFIFSKCSEEKEKELCRPTILSILRLPNC